MDLTTLEKIFAIIGMSLWVLFPIAMFLSVSHLDKIKGQVGKIDQIRRRSRRFNAFPQWDMRHHFHLNFRNWLKH